MDCIEKSRGARRECACASERREGTLALLFSPANLRRGGRENAREKGGREGRGGGGVHGEVRWTEGKMDRELDLPNLPPR